jgi:hypothetical protein
VSACGPLKVSLEDGETGGSSDEVGTRGESTSESSGAETSESSSDDATSGADETGEPPDACPAEPELSEYEVLLDGHVTATDFTDDGSIAWTHTCTVTSHVGSLASGETIELGCTDENAQPVEHTIELLAKVDGAPLDVSVVVGQQVELALWLRVWFGGTLAWTLRDGDDLLLLYFDGPYLPAEGEVYAAPLEHVAPLVVDLNSEVCPWVCSEANEGTFIPSDGCCRRETALRLDLGAGVVEVRNGSAAAIPGGGHAIVETSSAIDIFTCFVSDQSESYYAFTIVG